MILPVIYLEFHSCKMYVLIYNFGLHKEESMRFIKENTVFWLQKLVKNNLNIISKKFRGDTYNLFHEFISRITFLYDFLGKSRKKNENTVFGYKNASKFKKILFLKTLEVDYVTIPSLFLTTSHLGRIYNQKHIFL